MSTQDRYRPEAGASHAERSPSVDPRSEREGAQRRRVLMVFHAAPCLPALGPARRHYHMFREVSKYHDVSIVSLGTAGEAAAFGEEFAGQYRRATFVRPATSPAAKLYGKVSSALQRRSSLLSGQGDRMAGAIAAAVEEERPDVVLLSTLLLDPSLVPPGVPVVADTHNVEHDNLRRSARITRNPAMRAYRAVDAGFTRSDERGHGLRCRLVLATSARDAALLRALLPGTPVRVVPNGVDVGAALPTAVRRRRELLFAGMLSYQPNTHAVLWFVDQVLPIVRRSVPDVTLTIAGARPPRAIQARASPSVRVTGFVPSMQPYLESSRAMVAPLWAGGGTRVKILEAMAAGAAVVTTTVGCEGLGVRDGVHALVADTAEGFARACVRVLTDDALAERLQALAFSHVQSSFRWSAIGRSVARILAGVP